RLGGLGDRSEEQAGRGRHANRRAVVLGDVIGVETEPVVGLDDLEPGFVIVRERVAFVAVEMIEDTEFHDVPEDCSAVLREGSLPNRGGHGSLRSTKENPMPQVTINATDGGSFSAYLSLPKNVSGKTPGIVMMQQIFGANAEMRGFADDYAAQGYVAICPDLFWRLEPGVEIDP